MTCDANDNKENCMKYTCCGLSFLFISLFCVTCFGLLVTDRYDEYDCHIIHVKYPTTLPGSNSSVDESGNFCDCNCGKKCTSNLGVCEKLYITRDINKNSVMAQESTIREHSSGTECTFAEKKCLDGENINNRLNAIESSINKMKKYISMMQNNETIKCWSNNNDDELYLENEINWETFIIYASLAGAFTIIGVSWFLYDYIQEKKRMNKIMSELKSEGAIQKV